MNLLAVGPLAAKTKKETAKNGSAVLVVRCGVRDCPEILGRLWKDEENLTTLGLTEGYDFSLRERVWVKTKRAANRMIHHREAVKAMFFSVEDFLPDAERDQDETAQAMNQALSKDVTFEDFSSEAEDLDFFPTEEEKAAMRARFFEEKREKTDTIGACIDFLPIIVKCARCGRLSKISP